MDIQIIKLEVSTSPLFYISPLVFSTSFFFFFFSHKVPQLTLYLPRAWVQISSFSKEPWFLLVGTVLTNKMSTLILGVTTSPLREGFFFYLCHLKMERAWTTLQILGCHNFRPKGFYCFIKELCRFIHGKKIVSGQTEILQIQKKKQ